MTAFRDRVASVCRRLPGAEVSDPWGGGHDAWKVGGKLFAVIGAEGDGVSVKTPDIETATMLIDLGIGRKAPYFHRSWVQLPAETDAEELAHRIRGSYDLIRAGLPKRVREAVPPAPGE